MIVYSFFFIVSYFYEAKNSNDGRFDAFARSRNARSAAEKFQLLKVQSFSQTSISAFIRNVYLPFLPFLPEEEARSVRETLSAV